jgi:glycerophosphoryl diester phosphodiesterase
MPVVSQHYAQFFNWSGRGEVDPVELKRFRDHVAEAHRQGKKVRLWATPDNKRLWSFLLDEGADLINTDRLEAFETYYRARD